MKKVVMYFGVIFMTLLAFVVMAGILAAATDAVYYNTYILDDVIDQAWYAIVALSSLASSMVFHKAMNALSE